MTSTLPRAAALQAQGRTGEALAAFDLLGLSRDRSVRARALLAALDLRVATGALRPAAAAVAGLRLTDRLARRCPRAGRVASRRRLGGASG